MVTSGIAASVYAPHRSLRNQISEQTSEWPALWLDFSSPPPRDRMGATGVACSRGAHYARAGRHPAGTGRCHWEHWAYTALRKDRRRHMQKDQGLDNLWLSRALVIDDLIAGGSSILDVAHFLSEHDLMVHDAVVLVDRGPDTRLRLKHEGINLISILKLDVMMNLYPSNGLIDDEQYQRYLH